MKSLALAFQELSEAYRSRVGFTIDTKEKALAYLIYRTPATMGVLRRVLREVRGDILSVCDCGAGAGTSFAPLCDFFPLEKATLIEENKQLISLGKELNDNHAIVWRCGDLRKVPLLEHDLFLFSYSLNELSPGDATLVIKKAFQKTKMALVIIEPGTPEGYKRLLGYREALIEAGGYVVAPCPHMNECPLSSGDWCHFSQRIERTKEHRYLKGGTLGFEDEKFSYLIVMKKPHQPLGERVIRAPRKEKHGLLFTVCGYDGLEERLVSKRDKIFYTSLKKRTWGDTL